MGSTTSLLTKADVFIPISDFSWDGKSFSIPGFFSILRSDAMTQQLECSKLLSNLHDSDQTEIDTASHWAIFEQAAAEPLTAASKINIFLMALWLAIPTRTRVKFRFELPSEADCSKKRRGVRMLDQFQFIGSQVQEVVKTEQLEEAATYIAPMRQIYLDRKRLWNSLALTMYGCMAYQWQVAFTCFSSAVEGILTYKKGAGITKRLAKSFACLTHTTKAERDKIYQSFSHSYGIRGDILHGRIGNSQDSSVNLTELAQCYDLLRLLWKTVLVSPGIVSELEKADADREKWFARLESNYSPPV